MGEAKGWAARPRGVGEAQGGVRSGGVRGEVRGSEVRGGEAAHVDELAAGRIAREQYGGGVEVDVDAVGYVPRQTEDERLGAHRAKVVLDAHLARVLDRARVGVRAGG